MRFPGVMRIELTGEYGRMNESFSNLVFGLAAAAHQGFSANLYTLA